ncbi:hypothetical protein COMA2_170041 [Candidatus Nitrospira nitrificans]|uniref:CAAX prenyl protease 2/Lysostaphin resistance protein A-like domain-containing protein n=2 Tax=Candidatus Nitrospira nitrificans TaxID=1742973 RepID=A0A0S4L9X7_9BACT|nr:hypothetical protein COMA2_170041 [Candidatus Nitrospira nitrificans]
MYLLDSTDLRLRFGLIALQICLALSAPIYLWIQPESAPLGYHSMLEWDKWILVLSAMTCTWKCLEYIRQLHGSRYSEAVISYFVNLRLSDHQLHGTVFVAILEETLYRGLISPFASPYISVIAFSLSHKGTWVRLSSLLFAICMELSLSWSASLVLCIAIHTAVNITTWFYIRTIPIKTTTEGTIAIAL